MWVRGVAVGAMVAMPRGTCTLARRVAEPDFDEAGTVRLAVVYQNQVVYIKLSTTSRAGALLWVGVQRPIRERPAVGGHAGGGPSPCPCPLQGSCSRRRAPQAQPGGGHSHVRANHEALEHRLIAPALRTCMRVIAGLVRPCKVVVGPHTAGGVCRVGAHVCS
jgi:hypothetical protein